MANQVELIEGFDHFGTTVAHVGRYYIVQGGSNSVGDASAIVVEGRFMFCPNGGAITMGPLPADDEYYVGYHFWNTSANPMSGNGPLLREGTTEHGRITFNADNTISISRAGSIVATSGVVGPWLQNIPHYLEVYYRVHDSTGGWEVRLDGNAIIAPTSGLDTRNGGTLGIIDNVFIAGSANLGAVVDNFYAASGSAGFQGEGRVVTDVAASDGSHTAWTPNTGARWQAVDDVPADDDTTYISNAISADRNSFDMATFGVTGLIRAVAVAIVGRKDDAGTRQVRLSLRSGGTDYDASGVIDLVTAYAGHQRIWAIDPATAVAFDAGDIDSIEVGVVTV